MTDVLRLPFSGQRLWEVRERAGLSRPELAAKVNDEGHARITAQHIGRLERNESRPRPGTLKALRLALQVEVDVLLGDTDDAAASL